MSGPILRSPPEVREARFVARENRFVVRVVLDDREVPAYLPNTARLTDVLVPGAPLVLEESSVPTRRTRWTLTRVWDGTWVALAASAANGLVAHHLEGGGALPGWPPATAVRREVTRGRHRFDLEVDLEVERDTAIVEVKSLSRAREGTAPLSGTPSRRGIAHLTALSGRAAAHERVAVVFVVQRADVDVLDLGAPADPGWIAAVRSARSAGVHVVAYRCEVDPQQLRLGPALEVVDRPHPRSTNV